MNFIYWLYQWQLKGYRRDRMMLFIKALGLDECIKLLFAGRKKRPRVTTKIVLIAVTALFVLLIPVIFTPKLSVFWVIVISTYLIVGGPIAIAVSVALWSIPSFIIERFLLYMAKRKRAMLPNLLVIGVTGSYGKTSTKDAIARVLSVTYKVLKTPKSANGEIGVALHTLRALDSSYEVYVVEMGAYYRGVIRLVADAMKPKIGVLTGINEQHAGLFGGVENIVKAKLELMDALPLDGTAVVNSADANVLKVIDDINVPVMTYESSHVNQNLQAARVVGKLLGMTNEQINKGLAKVVPSKSRTTVCKITNAITIVDDTYNSNSTGFRSAVETLTALSADRYVVVCTGIYELGKDAKRVNYGLYREIISQVDDMYIVEPLHKKYYPSARVILSSQKLYDEIVNIKGSVAILFEGRSQVSFKTIKMLDNNKM